MNTARNAGIDNKNIYDVCTNDGDGIKEFVDKIANEYLKSLPPSGLSQLLSKYLVKELTH